MPWSETSSRRTTRLRASLRRGGAFGWLLALTLFAPWLRADYPIASHRYLADPAVLVSHGRVYLYCSNDDENSVDGGYVMKSLVCVSSSDLKNWTDHGVVFRVPANATWASYAWAPAVIARHGKFFLYFGNNASGIGVASGASPIGPFIDARGGYLINSSTPGVLPATNMWIFDPAVFIDDDEQAYLYFGGNGVTNARVIKLNADMISTAGSAVTIATPNFFEAAWLHKRNGLYYFSYSANPGSGLTIDYLTSSDPMSGFTHRGTVAGQPPSNNNNNHHAIFAFNGAWYHAYHNRSVATQAGIPTTYRRNLGLERLDYNADGTIQRIAYTTDGVVQLASLNPYVRVEAETMNAQSGIQTEPCSDGGLNLHFATDGAWIKIRGTDFGSTGASGFTAKVASASDGGGIEIRIGSPTGPLAGTCSTSGTGGWQTWTTQSCAITGASGVQDLFLKFKAGSSAGLNVDWWRFEPTAPIILVEPADKTVFPGATLSLALEAAGTGNTFQWFRDGVALTGQTRATLSIPGASASDSGTYSARVTNAGGAATTTTRAVTVRVTPEASRLVNVSCRTQLGAGQIATLGFFVAGAAPKQVLIRAAGPALGAFGLTNLMADPQFKIFRGTTVIAQNDNWDGAAIGGAFARVGAFALAEGSRDAALLTMLPAAESYSVQLSGVGTSAGILLLEVYDADPAPATSRFTNLSVLGPAGVDAASLIVGFVLAGTGQRPLLVRGAGPALRTFGVGDALADPQLQLYDSGPRLLQTNYGWTTDESAAALTTAGSAVGAFPFAAGSRDTAMLATLAPALYSIRISPISTAAGAALAEIYEVP